MKLLHGAYISYIGRFSPPFFLLNTNMSAEPASFSIKNTVSEQILWVQSHITFIIFIIFNFLQRSYNYSMFKKVRQLIG
jgi:hypothetical protein